MKLFWSVLQFVMLQKRNVDPYKAKIFEDYKFLQNEFVKNTSWFLKREMPLPGLKLIDGQWRGG